MATRDVSPQIAYSNRSRTWHFPAHYYTFTEDVGTDPASGKHRVAQFVMIDTVLLSVGVDGILSSEEQGRSEAHWAWLASTLAASTADYLVVAGHYPVWSVCSHGPTPLLVQRLRPLLAASKASAYFYGHDRECPRAPQLLLAGERVASLTRAVAPHARMRDQQIAPRRLSTVVSTTTALAAPTCSTLERQT